MIDAVVGRHCTRDAPAIANQSGGRAAGWGRRFAHVLSQTAGGHVGHVVERSSAGDLPAASPWTVAASCWACWVVSVLNRGLGAVCVPSPRQPDQHQNRRAHTDGRAPPQARGHPLT